MIRLWGRNTGETTWAKLGAKGVTHTVMLYVPRSQQEFAVQGMRQFCRTMKGRWAYFDGIAAEAPNMPPDGLKAVSWGFERKEDAALFRMFYCDFLPGAHSV